MEAICSRELHPFSLSARSAKDGLLIMSWLINGSLNTRDKVSKAEEHLAWLKENHWQLNCEEIYRLDEIRKAPVWKLKAFEYVEAKRMKYDADYKAVRSLEIRMNRTANQLRDIEAKAAQAKLQSEESLLEENARLNDENHWLRTELSGLKQTASIIAKARELG